MEHESESYINGSQKPGIIHQKHEKNKKQTRITSNKMKNWDLQDYRLKFDILVVMSRG